MDNLISHIEYTKYLEKHLGNPLTFQDFTEYSIKYADFLSQKLKKGMFIACDKDDNILYEPQREHFSTDFDYKSEICVYNEAKAAVVFEDIEYVEAKLEKDYSFFRIAVLSKVNYPELWKSETVEDLIRFNLNLTERTKSRFLINK